MRAKILTSIATLAVSAYFIAVQGKPAAASKGVAALHVPRGFQVEQVSTPDLTTYPMMGTLDDRGRLFLCESSGNTLNNDQMSANPDYKIRMLEDRDGDGVFDHSTVFADQLTLPAGAVWHKSSLYVASPPDLLRFDGATGNKEVLVTGWKMSANAASLHGPFFGPDGWLYLTDGRHGFDIKTKDGRELKGMASRIWRVRPDGTGLESFAGGGFDNPVELVFTPSGETIGTMTYYKDPENGERDALLHFVEGGVYPKWYSVVSEFKRTGDLMPVMTKFRAHRAFRPGAVSRRGVRRRSTRAISSARSSIPIGVQRHIVYREGATFRTEDQDFLTSSDPDFHPTDVMEDADGSLLVVDTGAWFIHGCPISRVAKPEIKGAVYRIRKTGAPAMKDPRGEKLNLPGMAPAALAKLLEDRRPVVRDRAVELLVDAGDGRRRRPGLRPKRSGSARRGRLCAVPYRHAKSGSSGSRGIERRRFPCADGRGPLRRNGRRSCRRRPPDADGGEGPSGRQAPGRGGARPDRRRSGCAVADRRRGRLRRPLRRALHHLFLDYAGPDRTVAKRASPAAG